MDDTNDNTMVDTNDNTMVVAVAMEDHNQIDDHNSYSYNNNNEEIDDADAPSMFDEMMSRGERLRQLRLLAQADEEEREQQKYLERQQRRRERLQRQKKDAKVNSHLQHQQQQGVIITNESMNLIIEHESNGGVATNNNNNNNTTKTTCTINQHQNQGANLNIQQPQKQHHLSESGFTNSTTSCSTSNSSSNSSSSSYNIITEGQLCDKNEFEFIEEQDYNQTEYDDNDNDNDDDDDNDNQDEEEQDKIDILPESKLQVLRYESYIAHQRYNDDYKHANCHFVDFGYIGGSGSGSGEAESESESPNNNNMGRVQVKVENVEEEGWDCLSLPLPLALAQQPVTGGNRLIIQQDKALGKGGLVWDAGVILADHLLATQKEWVNSTTAAATATATATAQAQNNEISKCTRVVELGAGTGVTGLMLAKAVPSSYVYITDLPDLLFLMQHNVERNFHPHCIIGSCAEGDNNDNNNGSENLYHQDILSMERGDAAREVPTKLKMVDSTSLQLSDVDINALYDDEDVKLHKNSGEDSILTTTTTTTTTMKQSAGNVAARVLRWGMKEDYQDGPFDVVIAGDVVTSLYDPVALAKTLYDLCHEESVVYVSFKRRLSEVHTKFESAMHDRFESITFVDPITRHRNIEQIRIMVARNMKKVQR